MFVNGAQMKSLGTRIHRMGHKLDGQNRETGTVEYIEALIEYIGIHKDIIRLSGQMEDFPALTIYCIIIEMAKVNTCIKKFLYLEYLT